VVPDPRRPRRAAEGRAVSGARSRTHGTRPVVGEWADDAACKGASADQFFPGTRVSNAEIARRAAICHTCPVAAPCLDHAIHWHEPGIWGGTTAQQRRRIKAGTLDRPPWATEDAA
jgi:WhiB family transcriptional regulator, redox-sensing transcriptional regulator